MALQLGCISLIIPIPVIEKYYPGGFARYRKDKRYFSFDGYIAREGRMDPGEMEDLVREWEALGVKSTVMENGKEKWNELCVVEGLGGKTLPCDWLVENPEEWTVSHIDERSEHASRRIYAE